MEKILDLKNLACPGPVIETKKVLEKPEITKVVAYVDNLVAKENLLRLASSVGVEASFEEEQGIYAVTLEKKARIQPEGGAAAPPAQGAKEKRQGENGTIHQTKGGVSQKENAGILPRSDVAQDEASWQEGDAFGEEKTPSRSEKIYFLTSDEMGRGNSDLGKLLMKGFLYAITQLPTPPKAVILVNSAVKLSSENSETVEHLKALEAKGTNVISCGTCLHFYQLTEQLQVGIIGNMYDIASELEYAPSVTVG